MSVWKKYATSEPKPKEADSMSKIIHPNFNGRNVMINPDVLNAKRQLPAGTIAPASTGRT